MPRAETTTLTAFPMHGQHKLLSEGYRTRDGHFIEWFGRILRDQGQGQVAVLSRPEPLPLAIKHSFASGDTAPNTRGYSSASFKIPNLRDPRKWWVDSLGSYRGYVGKVPTPTISWNPFLSLSNVWADIQKAEVPLVFDLLDDWTLHYAFSSVKAQVTRAYQLLFEAATTVTANAEGTLDLAHRLGRSDAILIPNGCDPQRFSTASTASGPSTIGYVGKIGKRLDLGLILNAADSLPNAHFVFAGPILDPEYQAPLAERENIELLGDVHYQDVPELLQSFDVGWVPHRVGDGEVGGDVIKTYEYRAAGLPVLTTPVMGSVNRGLDHVYSLDGSQHVSWIDTAMKTGRVARVVSPIPVENTWEFKARTLLGHLGLKQ